jgi:predicted secreted Zn-dependent protease
VILRTTIVYGGLAALAMAHGGPAFAADWKATEQVKNYAITGTTGIGLYESIGERGPSVGVGRTVAYTTFDLKWSRKYEPQADGSCRLVSAKPFLTITYTLPKPAAKLPSDMQGRWKVFIDGITRHEKVHGDHMKEMVERILATTVGFSAANDPKCQKIRKEITRPLSEASLEQRQKSRDFDKVEMSDGGNVHRLILDLVNGD